MDAAPTARKRSKLACKNCRRKKARCPAERPVCSFCQRLNQACEYDPPSVQEQPAKAVLQPNSLKLAERIAELESRIAVLIERNTATSVSTTPSPSPQHGASFELPSNILTSDSLYQTDTSPVQPHMSLSGRFDSTRYQFLPPDHIVLAAIDAYFRACHNYPCTFFDEARFRNSYAYGAVPNFLLLTLVASVAHLLVDPWFEDDHLTAAKLIAQAAWQQILADFLPSDDANSIEIVQATALLSLLDFKCENHQAGTLKLRIAITIAQDLHLNLEPDYSISTLEQEERRYIFWTLYLMDRLSALVFDRPYLIRDDECALRLPEDISTLYEKQCNQMPYLNAATTHAIPVSSNCAKKIIAMSVLGSMVSFCHGSQLHSDLSPAQENGPYSRLISQADRLGRLLQKDTLRSDSISTGLTDQSENFSQSEAQSTFQYRCAQIAFHIIQIFINHPFLLRRHPSLVEVSSDPNSLHHKLSICQQHAVKILEVVDIAQQAGILPNTLLFPGWVIFSAGIVHCLFTHSPDMVTAQKSKEYLQRAQLLMYNLSMADGTSQTRRYSAMLDFLSRNAGFSSWLVDPSFPRFNHPSKSTSYWRFTDFDWLCEQFCVGANLMSSTMSLSIPAPQKEKQGAVKRTTGSGSSVGNTRYSPTSSSIYTNMQNSQEDRSEYLADSRSLQPTSTFSLQRFGLLDDLDFDNHDSVTGVTGSRTGDDHMYPGFNPFQ